MSRLYVLVSIKVQETKESNNLLFYNFLRHRQFLLFATLSRGLASLKDFIYSVFFAIVDIFSLFLLKVISKYLTLIYYLF